MAAWQRWRTARLMTQRARYLSDGVATEAELRRARRLFSGALRALADDAPISNFGELRSRAIHLSRRRASPPARAARRWIGTRPQLSLSLLGGLLLVLAASAAWMYRVELGISANLARGKAWVASTTSAGLLSAGQLGPPSHFVFFHTDLEGSPNLVVDLGRSITFRRIRVSNRIDCCQSRALPLLVEVSDDGERWRALVLRQTPFQVLDLQVGAVKSRFVRFRGARASYLHLVDVGVYR